MGAGQVSVEASAQGSAVAIRARATIEAPRALIWQTLTDYDHLSEFIPGMTTSRVIARHGSAAIVQQTGRLGFLMFEFPIRVVVESREEPPAVIRVRMLNGNLKQLNGGYTIEKISGKNDEYVLRWSGVIDRPAMLPAFITVPLMRTDIADQFRGMVKEIERRQALVTGQQAARKGRSSGAG